MTIRSNTNTKDLKDKVIVITGGAGLLGSEFCDTIAVHGGKVIIADSNEESSEALAEKLSARKLSAIPFKVDINDADSVSGLIKYLDNTFGKIDALVNNAYPRNKNYGREFFDVEYQDFCENINMNMGGYFLTSQKFAQYYIRQGWGNIINIASVYGVIAPKFEIYEGTEMTMPVEYAFIKSGIIHFTRYLAKYLKGRNIRVNSVSPGGIRDRQQEEFVKSYRDKCLNKGMLDPRDIAGTIVFLLSDASSFINGQNLIVDDGYTL